MKTIQHKGYTLIVNVQNYSNNKRKAIQLIDSEDGCPYCMATINLPEVQLLENEVIIKDYSENEGILHSLVKADIIEDTGKTASSGYTYGNVCKLLI